MTTPKPIKILGRKAYGSIGHLPGSRMGPGDHHVNEGQAHIATVKARKGDTIIVQEKLDGSCCAVHLGRDGILHALGRAGYPAITSPFEQHWLFAEWVERNARRFRDVLQPGERLVGEWLAQAHGTRYQLWHGPFVPFDLMVEDRRLTYDEFRERVRDTFVVPGRVLTDGPVSIEHAMHRIGGGFHGAIDPVEGAVWRVEREGRVDFLCKYVRPDKMDGLYLPEVSGSEAVWNWRPEP